MHYLRYIHPALAVLLPVIVVTTFRTDGKRASFMILAVCILNLAFQNSANWMLKSGAVKETILAYGRDEPLFEHYAPERLLADAIRDRNDTSGNVVVLDAAKPFIAELGGRARTIAWYAPALEVAALEAEADPSGGQWIALFRREDIRHVILRDDSRTPARDAALAGSGAVRRARFGEASWWQLPEPRSP
jgi:hypothetical protein